MATNRKDIVQRINEGFAENNLEKVLSFCTDDITWTMVGDTTVRGKDPIRQWMASMNPQPPQLAIHQTIGEGDTVVARGDMVMRENKDGPPIPYTFCDIYRFAGEKVIELTAFVVRTDRTRADDRTANDVTQMASSRQLTECTRKSTGIRLSDLRCSSWTPRPSCRRICYTHEPGERDYRASDR